MNTEPIDALTRSLAGSFAFCGVALAKGNARHIATACAPGISADKDSMFRVASVSKHVVGQAVAAFLDVQGIGWKTDAADILGWPLRHPDHPDVPVTLGMITAHHAGLTDDAGYIVPADQTLQDWCAQKSVFNREPGTYFAYANLGYVILAEVLERLAGVSFVDAIAPYVPNPGGFNWHGVPPAHLTRRLPTYRSDHGTFIAQIDDEITPIAQSRNPGVFSPQGGLRTSLAGMLHMAELLPQADLTELWTPQMGAGDYLDGVFERYGPGVQIFHDPHFYPRPLVGHFGNAYGFNGGVWYDKVAGLSFAYALNGLPLGDESDEFSKEELQVFEVIAAI